MVTPGVPGIEGHTEDITTPRVRVAAGDSWQKSVGGGVMSSGSGPVAITALYEKAKGAVAPYPLVAIFFVLAAFTSPVDACRIVIHLEFRRCDQSGAVAVVL